MHKITNSITKKHRYFTVRDLQDPGNIDKLLENNVNNVTNSGRDIMILSPSETSLKTACYSEYDELSDGNVIYIGRTLEEIKTYPNITILGE